MKHLHFACRLLLCMLLPFSAFAQQKADFRILLNSGNYIPPANAKSITQETALMSKSRFKDYNYVVLQFNTLPDAALKQKIAAAGIELIDYLPNLAYTASVKAGFDARSFSSYNIRSVFQLSAAQKTVADILKKKFPAHAVKQAGTVDLNVVTYKKMDLNEALLSFSALKITVLEDAPMFRRFTIRIPQQNVNALLNLAYVQWADVIDPPNQLENTPGRTLHRVNVLNDGLRNLKGEGMSVGIWDGGAISRHIDFSPVSRLIQVQNAATSDHSTHCSGTIMGRGLINPLARGMAPNAMLYSYDFNGNIQTEMAAGIPANNLVVSSHSYGSTQTCGVTGAGVTYSNTSRETDINLNNFPFHLHCHSAGNSQTACSGGWSTITASGKSAKNNILVANITTTETISGSSSFGPVSDGRVKPEISAMGTNVFSTVGAPTAYDTYTGTSMATPGIAGSVTLLVQRYKQLNSDNLPPSTLIKNIVLNTAKDLGNPGPDYRFGYGRINALQAVRIIEPSVRYVIGNVTTGGTNDLALNVPAGAARVRVMLTWNDPAGAANANPALVNNLDLRLINGAVTTLPWILDKNNPSAAATRGVDNVSNIEQVTIDNPAAGNYTMRVNGAAVPVGASQSYALTWWVEMPYIEVTYPNGGESLNPGSQEIITWDNAGVTGNQTIEYSLNGGTTWTTLSTTVPATTNRFSFSVPNANTATALVRVSAGSLTDVSDAAFKILGTVTGFTSSAVAGCNSGQLSFTWNAVTNALQYDIYKLDAATGQYVIIGTNISGTSYTATGLTPGENTYFTIIAKNNTSAAVSERAVAINATISSGGGGLGAVGSVSGQSAICGSPSGIVYSIPSVSGATTYTWTVPSGAIIASGQGTTSISVNFPAGSVSGNVSVAAGNGSCQTAPATLAVSVGSGTVSAPVSGGNQSQTVCPGGTIPTLTATASVPAGQTIVWYSAATGGTVVANPVKNTAGSITYYGAARITSSGCEGTSRTPVTLTITTVSQAAIAAGSTTSFCQGSSVVLTATTGTGYQWLKDGGPVTGAVGQSYTASSAGSYSVIVTTGTCTSTSAPIAVNVVAPPAAVISASGPTTFCTGSNVTLTASAGNSWLWSTGANAQSITVSASGAYSVTITSAGGCTSVSPATTVSAAAQITAAITASPYNNLFPGISTTLTANVNPPGNYTFSWYKNGALISGVSGATLSNIDFEDLGMYTVRVTNTATNCTVLSAGKAIGDSATSRLFIYPSPNKGKFKAAYYSGTLSSDYMLLIYDSKGAKIYERRYLVSSPYQSMDVDLKSPAKGVYHVVLTDKSGKKITAESVVVE
jgi:hypothetical protein